MTPLSIQRVSDAMLILVLGVVLGGRLGYVLFYDLPLLWRFTADVPFWGVLRIHEGGMSSHGGILGVIIASWVVSRGFKDKGGIVRERVPWPHVLDITAIACTPGLMLGRLANFINGELLGAIYSPPGKPGPWWTIQFPQERATPDPLSQMDHAPALDPQQSMQLLQLLDQYRLPGQSDEAAYQHVVHLLQTGPTQVQNAIAAGLSPLLASRYPSQLMQAATDGLILGGILWLIWWKPRRPGVIGAWFMILYGIMRILTEMVRLPDPQLEGLKQSTGFSMGQWLSAAMIAIGSASLVYFRIRPRPDRFGGWLRPSARPVS
jgi:phosphatidylglycerol---prolipoprotein diacylglyceryl transferase